MNKARRALTYGGFIASLSLCFGAVLPLRTTAATPASTNAIRVSPALSNIQLSAGETSATVATTITNLTNAPLAITIAARDFGASPVSSSSIQLFGKGYDPATNTHGLQTAVSFTNQQVTLAPHETQKIPVTLNSVDKLAPGGHYGAVLFSPAPAAAKGAHTKVAIHSAVASLIFLKTASGGTQTLKLVPFSVSPLKFSLPGTNYIAFKDTGNTQSAPQGQLTLYGPTGSIVSTEVINPGSGLVLPGTSRLFTTPLPLSHPLLARPGVYRLELQYRDTTQNKFTVVNKRFFYINLYMLLAFIALCMLAFYLVKRFASKLIRGVRKLFGWLKRLFRKPPPPPPAEKPKKPRPLIQG